MQIIDLRGNNQVAIQQLATLLLEQWPNSWPDMDSALKEVGESLAVDRISRIAVDDNGSVLGWIGGQVHFGYNGNVWELHPLIVKSDYRGKGIGRSLVADLEEQVRQRGAIVLWVGTDDDNDMTSLAGVSLYPNVWEHISKIQNLYRHPYEFYYKCGFVIVGVMPDANGIGKPDIYMAKPLGKR